jgi:hypothetical protein
MIAGREGYGRHEMEKARYWKEPKLLELAGVTGVRVRMRGGKDDYYLLVFMKEGNEETSEEIHKILKGIPHQIRVIWGLRSD